MQIYINEISPRKTFNSTASSSLCYWYVEAQAISMLIVHRKVGCPIMFLPKTSCAIRTPAPVASLA